MSDTPGSKLSIGKPDYTSLTFPEAPPERPYVITNMVMSLDGTVVVEGSERGLGSPNDQALMRELRVNADVVMNGAGTLRASGTSSRVGEQYQALRQSRGRTPNPIAAVVSSSGDLPLDRPFFTERDFEAVVYLASTVPAERLAAVEATGRRVEVFPSEGFMGHILRHMREELGAEVLLVEGGPHLLGSLVDVGAVDEYFLTMGPVVVAHNKPLAAAIGPRPPEIDELTHLELVSLAHEPQANELYLRYRVTDRRTKDGS